MANSQHCGVLLRFLELLSNKRNPNYGQEYIAVALQPSLDLEASFRTWCKGSSGSDARASSPNPDFDNLYFGLFDVFTVPSVVRIVHPRKENTPVTVPAPPVPAPPADCACVGNVTRFSFYSETAHVICSFPRSYMFPLRRAMFRNLATPCMVENLATFQANFEIFTHGALAGITNWDNMAITGGAGVVASLAGRPPRDGGDRGKGLPWSVSEINDFYQSDLYRTSDVDIFLYGLTPDQAIEKTKEIYSAISKSALWPLTVIRKHDRISIHTLYPIRPVHIHLDVYPSPAAMIASCNIDCSCCLYDGSTVYMNARSLVAFMFQSNRVDLKIWSGSYEERLAKYANRGFEVHVPFLQREKVAYNRIYDRTINYLPFGLAGLLVLELLSYMPDHLQNLNHAVLTRVVPDTLPHPSTLAPISKRLANTEDSLWSQVPYGPQWDSHSLPTLVESINRTLNYHEDGASRQKLHRHPIYSSSRLSDCLGVVCTSIEKKCPPATTKADRHIILCEGGRFCRGPLEFYPKRIRTGSLPLWNRVGKNLGQEGTWTYDAYLPAAKVLDEDVLKEIPRHIWHNIVLAGMSRIRCNFGGYSDVEGAAPALLSQFRVYVEIDSLMNISGHGCDHIGHNFSLVMEDTKMSP